MPREPANPFGLRWSPLAALIFEAGLPGGGVLWPFGPWDPQWWQLQRQVVAHPVDEVARGATDALDQLAAGLNRHQRIGLAVDHVRGRLDAQHQVRAVAVGGDGRDLAGRIEALSQRVFRIQAVLNVCTEDKGIVAARRLISILSKPA